MTATLKVNGKAFDGFERGAVFLSMENPANDFDVEYVADGKDLAVRAVFPGDEVDLALDDDVILSGYVETTSDDDDSEAVRLTAAGRSRTTDLVACSMIEGPFTWKNTRLDRILLDLCRPFGIDVTVLGADSGPIDTFAIVRGESVYDSIMRLAPRRGKVVYCVGGDLVLATVGSTRTKTALIRGQDVLVRSSRVDSWAERYSDYVYCTQTAGKDDRWGSAAAQIRHLVTDETITRYRPILVEADAHHKAELQARASLERNQRAGRGERVVATVNGWFTGEGTAWRPNTLVRFRNPVLGIDADLLVVSARFRFGAEEPKETELVLGRPEAFDVVDYPKSKRGEAWR